MEKYDEYEALKKLKNLLDAGILSQEEFNDEKAKVLGTALTEEQKVLLNKLEALKDAGILTEEEYMEQKRAAQSQSPTTIESKSNLGSSRQHDKASTSAKAPKKKSGTVWIILGAVACVFVLLLALGGGSGDYSGGYDGLMSNPYSAVDNYIDYNNDCYRREGNTVYYSEQQDDYGAAGILGSVLRNPSTEFGQMFSGAVRESALSTLIQQDYQMFQAIAQNGLNFIILWYGQEVFFYSPEEIKMKMSY